MCNKIAICLAAALCIGCTASIPADPPADACRLFLAGCISSADTRHSVQIRYSYQDRTEPATDVVLKCFVNGSEKAWSREWFTYSFDADLKPGDTVRIEAHSSSAGTASVEITVPEKPVCGNDWKKRGGYVDLYPWIQDSPETEDYYRIEVNPQEIDLSRDPLLSASAGEKTSYNSMRYYVMDNGTSFSDACFSGRRQDFVIGLVNKPVPGSIIKVRISRIERSEYIHGSILLLERYLTTDHDYYGFQMLPENISGGMGLVTAVASEDFKIEL